MMKAKHSSSAPSAVPSAAAATMHARPTSASASSNTASSNSASSKTASSSTAKRKRPAARAKSRRRAADTRTSKGALAAVTSAKRGPVDPRAKTAARSDRELAQTILVELYAAAERAPREVGELARRLSARPTQVARVLLRLEERGLIDPERVRLTLAGLSIAASLGAAARFATHVA